MLSIYQLKPKFQSLLRPYTDRLYKSNITANQVTLFACLGSVVIAFIVGLLASYQWIFGLIPLWMFIRMALNAIDGMLAREYNQKSNLGAYLNEICDVISDCALLLIFTQLVDVNIYLVIFVVLLSFLTEYSGILGVMIGASRRYDGPMGKSDRALILGMISLGIATYLLPLSWINALLWIISFLLIYTVINRVRKGMQEANK
ncbi:CDP-diacylglycerol--glycerol-3-phosphate 3-phosphatidyltransferase [Gilliamella bombicola]|uniref:CDP-diacylglycerol--glycerol-3-phosphate 3-phosphatidyltransferase n=1 Tax=Gilliamella bombicola TaxID=1798182 RepID=A0A1C4ABU9_9GAMM|nr:MULTISPECIES: CDP-alcohol phosphatidyltransferase family protein [Gilliamella]NUF27199.1 CDP-alcohol phosphatidyltransferase family protein [Gilliamella sp. ESL0254]SCB92010.1 CDP-diacylglycerol--glycerol-3-phosphate 3-phosphatidyltransferase [Gilliamella bombicola]